MNPLFPSQWNRGAPHLFVPARPAVGVLGEEGRLRRRVVVEPLAEVVGQVEAAVVVAAVLEVDERQPLATALGVAVSEDVALLEVVVTEHHGRWHTVEIPPAGGRRARLETAACRRNRQTRESQ